MTAMGGGGNRPVRMKPVGEQGAEAKADGKGARAHRLEKKRRSNNL